MGTTETAEAGTSRDRRAPGARDAGVTFVEILITVVLMGTVVIGILAATRTSIIASRTSEEAAQVQSALLAAAERVERAPRDQFPCESLRIPVENAAKLTFGVDDPTPYVEVVTEHLMAGEWKPNACPSTGFQANLLQRLTITMTHPGSGLERTLEVIKGDA